MKKIAIIWATVLVALAVALMPATNVMASGTYSTTANFDAGTAVGITTITDRYNQSAGTIELDFPYADKDSNLTAYYRMEGILDEAGVSGNLLLDGVTNVTLGKFGNAYDFDGTNDLTTITNRSSMYPGTGNYTISFWYSNQSLPTVFDVMYDAGNVSGLIIGMNVNGSLYINLTDLASNEEQIGSATWLFDDSDWHLITFVWDSFADWGRIYTDGTVITTDYYINGTMGNIVSDTDITLGSNGTGAFADCRLDELRIYNRTLTPTEVLALNNSGNQYKTSGTWLSPTIDLSDILILQSVAFTMSGGDVNTSIDRIDIVQDGIVINSVVANQTSSGTLTSTDFSIPARFDTTRSDIKLKFTLVGNGTATPTISNITYTTVASTVSSGGGLYTPPATEPTPEPTTEPADDGGVCGTALITVGCIGTALVAQMKYGKKEE